MDISTVNKKILATYDSNMINRVYFEALKYTSTKHLIYEYYAKSIANYYATNQPTLTEYVILAGKGETGYIGLLVAKYLSLININTVHVILTSDVEDLNSEEQLQIKNLKKQGITISDLNTTLLNYLLEKIYSADIIIDALTGLDTNDHLQEPITDLIEFVNNADSYVASVNIPTGIDHNTGEMHNIAVNADTIFIGEIPTTGVLLLKANLYISNLYIDKNILDKFDIKSPIKSTLQDLIKVV